MKVRVSLVNSVPADSFQPPTPDRPRGQRDTEIERRRSSNAVLREAGRVDVLLSLADVEQFS